MGLCPSPETLPLTPTLTLPLPLPLPLALALPLPLPLPLPYPYPYPFPYPYPTPTLPLPPCELEHLVRRVEHALAQVDLTQRVQRHRHFGDVGSQPQCLAVRA